MRSRQAPENPRPAREVRNAHRNAWALAAPASEMDLRNLLRLLRDSEGFAHLKIRIHPTRDPFSRVGSQIRIVLLHGENVVATRNRDTIFGSFELRLVRKKILIRFEIGILLAHRQKPPQRAGERALILLEL